MATRNFYISADASGRATLIEGGPRAKDGGMSIHITQRSDGSITKAFDIMCFENDGVLTTSVRDHDDHVVAEFITKR